METFETVYKEIAPYTIVPEGRCRVLWHLARYAATLPGIMVELGTLRGGTAMLVKRAAANNPHACRPPKSLMAIDTFSGIPNATELDGHRNGDFALTDSERNEVIARLEKYEIALFGMKMEWASERIISQYGFCFAHFDADTYQSAKEFLAFFWPRMVTGGFMVFDDYGWPQCAGVKKALNEHAESTGAFALLTGEPYQAVLVKAGE